MKLLVCGSREFNSYEILKTKLDAVIKTLNTSDITIIHGGAEGADRLAGQYALDNQINCMCIPAKWKLYGKSAGFRRNIEMINMLSSRDLVVAFSVNQSKGTQHTIDNATSKNIKVIVYKFRKK